MYPTRDSLVWLFTLGIAILGYLMSAEKPPTEWNYREWLQAVSAIAAIISAKLQGSPLQLSYKGKAKIERGEEVFYQLPPKEQPSGDVEGKKSEDRVD